LYDLVATAAPAEGRAVDNCLQAIHRSFKIELRLGFFGRSRHHKADEQLSMAVPDKKRDFSFRGALHE
jgi:hypothetical protein